MKITKHQDRDQQEKLLQLASQFSQLSPQPRIRVWLWPPEADFIQLRCILSDTGAHCRFFRAWVPSDVDIAADSYSAEGGSTPPAGPGWTLRAEDL